MTTKIHKFYLSFYMFFIVYFNAFFMFYFGGFKNVCIFDKRKTQTT